MPPDRQAVNVTAIYSKMKTLYLILSFLTIFVYRAYAQDTVYLENYVGNLKKVNVAIGSNSYSFLFDSGGGETFISPEIAKSLGKTIYGSATGFRMSGEMIKYRKTDSISLNIYRTTIFHSTIGILDIMSLLPKGFSKLDGVLSLKSFQDKILTLDLANNRIILESTSSYRKLIKNKIALQSRFANGPDGNELIIFLGIHKQKHLYWFLFDSGNLGELLLSHRTAYEWGLESDTVSQWKQLGSLNINIGIKQFITEAASKDIIYDGSLNFAILSKATFIINFSQKQVWLD
jgi:hypothetical protein